MKPASAKNKGRVLCKELRARLLQVNPELGADDITVRSSGANGEDLILSPLARTVLLNASFECKNQEKINIWESIAQCEKNGKNHQPILIFRRNHSNTYAVVDSDLLIGLIRIAKDAQCTLIKEYREQEKASDDYESTGTESF